MPSNAEMKVQEYKENLKKKAEDLVLKEFPEKIMKLNNILETPEFCNRNLQEVHQDVNVPVSDPTGTPTVFNNKLENSLDGPSAKRRRTRTISTCESVPDTDTKSLSIPCNKSLCNLIDLVKPHIRQLVKDANMTKMWISYMIPKIEDGNNFGVSIQEETLYQVINVESEAGEFLKEISHYYTSRGKLVSKVAEYPRIEDYRRSVIELDEHQYITLWLMMCEIRNRYCTLHDLVIKNLEKLKKPRSENMQALY